MCKLAHYDYGLEEMATADKKRASRAAKQLIEANKESRLAISHARESISAHITFLKSARSYYQINELSLRETARKVAKIVELSRRNTQAFNNSQGSTFAEMNETSAAKTSSSIEEKNRQIFDQLNKVYSEELRPEEKDFLEQTKRYWRDRFADSE